MIGDSVEILLSLIAVFCLIVSRWMSSGGMAISIFKAYMGEVLNAALISLGALFLVILSVRFCQMSRLGRHSLLLVKLFACIEVGNGVLRGL
jgi:hypothetical protein